MNKTIRTGLYSNNAKQILTYLFLNMKRCRINWSMRDRATAYKFKLDIDINGEILLVEKGYSEIDHAWQWRRTAVGNRNDIEARKWLSWQIKNLVYGLYGKDVWKRTNNMVLPCYKKETVSYWTNDAQFDFDENDITVKMIYCLYDILNARSKSVKRYGAKFIDYVVGVERDPFLTEQEKIRREENERIKKEANIEIANLRSEYDAKIDAFKKQMIDECNAKQQAVRDKRDKELKELNEAFAAASQLAEAS